MRYRSTLAAAAAAPITYKWLSQWLINIRISGTYTCDCSWLSTHSFSVWVCLFVTCAHTHTNRLIPGNEATIHTILICRMTLCYRFTSSDSSGCIQFAVNKVHFCRKRSVHVPLFVSFVFFLSRELASRFNLSGTQSLFIGSDGGVDCRLHLGAMNRIFCYRRIETHFFVLIYCQPLLSCKFKFGFFDFAFYFKKIAN